MQFLSLHKLTVQLLVKIKIGKREDYQSLTFMHTATPSFIPNTSKAL